MSIPLPMSTRNLLVIIFWMVVLGGLLIEFLTPPKPHIEVGHITSPAYLTPPPSVPQPKATAEYLQQVSFIWTAVKNQPDKYKATICVANHTAHVAKNIRVRVRPYRETIDPKADSELDTQLTEDSTISQYGSWVHVDDLNPGESGTASVTFDKFPGCVPGANPGAVIKYTIETNDVITTPDTIAQEALKKKFEKHKPYVQPNIYKTITKVHR